MSVLCVDDEAVYSLQTTWRSSLTTSFQWHSLVLAWSCCVCPNFYFCRWNSAAPDQTPKSLRSRKLVFASLISTVVTVINFRPISSFNEWM